MKSANTAIGPVYPYEFTIPDEAVDVNGHVNNVICTCNGYRIPPSGTSVKVVSELGE